MTDPRPLTAGVMGWPITHSKSPLIFAHWFQQAGLNGRYCHLAVAEVDFETVVSALPKAGFRGVNVTVPHKISALEVADEATPTARAMGAANVLTFSPESGIIADNTDGYGFLENLKKGAPAWKSDTSPTVVLGAGGAARAVIHALLADGVSNLRLLNRSAEKAQALANDLPGPIDVIPWADRSEALEGAGLLVNATSLGMTGKPPLEISLGALPKTAIVTDLVYAPLETDLLAQARANANPIVDGLGMLLHQARPAFHAWFGIDPVVDAALREICLK
ncbi:MAG: shikimate dehydrogenase [Pseudomonadota bacterium]